MKLIVGLGNPGQEYIKTPHNAGFMAVEKIAENLGIKNSEFKEKKKLKSLTANAIIKNNKTVLALPATFMNNSGQAVRALMDYFKIPLEDLIVLHDDADIEAGKIKIANNSRSAGHKGVENIIQTLGTKNFKRIRIGVHLPVCEKISTDKYVLMNLNKKDFEEINKGINSCVNYILE